MKEFTSAVAAEEENAAPVEIKIDNRVIKLDRPTPGMMVMLLSALGPGQREEQAISTMVNILLGCMDRPDRKWFESRLLSPDPVERLHPDLIGEVFRYVTEEWTGRPTR